MAWKIIGFLLLLLLLVYCSLSQEDCSSKTSDIGELLKLDCSCGETDFQLEWFHSPNGAGGTESLVYSGGPNERSYTFAVRSTSLGGRYRCVCESCPNGCLECFDVSVTAPLNIIAFFITPSIARVNDTLTITCNATGYQYQPSFQVTREGNATMVISGLELSALENGGVTAVTTVTATLAHNGTFHCLVHNEYGGYDVASTSVVVYVPPAIVSILNFTVLNYSVQRTATLECVVNNRSSTDYVRWIRNGTTLENQSGKYVFQITRTAMGRAVATLGVRNLTRSDRGMYLCQAGSKYNTSESVVAVWILEDFRSPDITDEPPKGKDADGHTVGISVGLGVAIVFAAVVVIVVAIIYKKGYTKGLRCQGSSNDVPLSDQQSNPQAIIEVIRYHPPPTNGLHNGAVAERDGERRSAGGGGSESSSMGGVSCSHDGDKMSNFSHSSDNEIKGISTDRLRKRTQLSN